MGLNDLWMMLDVEAIKQRLGRFAINLSTQKMLEHGEVHGFTKAASNM